MEKKMPWVGKISGEKAQKREKNQFLKSFCASPSWDKRKEKRKFPGWEFWHWEGGKGSESVEMGKNADVALGDQGWVALEGFIP